MTRAELRAEQADCVARMKQSPDVFHPNRRVAAAFADLTSNGTTERYLEGEIKRLKDKVKRLGDQYEVGRLAEMKTLLKTVRSERPELEAMCATFRTDPVTA